MEGYIDNKKILYNTFLDFIDETNEMNFENLCENIKNCGIEEDREEMTQFLQIIKSISDHHHRDVNFFKKIEQILQNYKDQIKQKLSNDEIFLIFASNKLIILFLLENKIITLSDFIYIYMIDTIEPNGNRYCHFFYPELEKFKGEEKMKNIKNELLSLNPTAFEQFEEKRKEGENDSHICSLIRKDSVEEFIAYINRNSISVSSKIAPSIFETNSFLIEKKNTTLIEYSAFFGSIQIFQYLYNNNVELTPSLWHYSIHSQNAELINFLESKNVNPPSYSNNDDEEEDYSNEDNDYLACFIESIKCHHKDFSDYIENNLLLKSQMESEKAKEKILINSMKHHNYSYFQTDNIKENGFFYLCMYNYNKLVDFLLEEKEEEINKKIISNKIF